MGHHVCRMWIRKCVPREICFGIAGKFTSFKINENALKATLKWNLFSASAEWQQIWWSINDLPTWPSVKSLHLPLNVKRTLWNFKENSISPRFALRLGRPFTHFYVRSFHSPDFSRFLAQKMATLLETLFHCLNAVKRINCTSLGTDMI